MKQSDCTIEKSYVPSSFMKEAYCNQLVNEREFKNQAQIFQK